MILCTTCGKEIRPSKQGTLSVTERKEGKILGTKWFCDVTCWNDWKVKGK